MQWLEAVATYLPTYLPTYIPTYLPTYLPTYIPTYLPTYLHTHLPTYIPTYLPTYPPTTRSVHSHTILFHCLKGMLIFHLYLPKRQKTMKKKSNLSRQEWPTGLSRLKDVTIIIVRTCDHYPKFPI